MGERRVSIFGKVMLVVVVIWLLSIPARMTVPSPEVRPPGGDFAAFYGAGLIANAGDYSVLYDTATQRAAQQPLTNVSDGVYWYFAYPPIVATTFGPLATLPFVAAAIVYTVLMLAAWLVAAWLARPLLPRLLLRNWSLAVAVSLLFPPTTRVIVGGTNTAVTVLILVGVWRLLEADQDVAAGVLGSVLLYKPTFGVPLLAVWVLAKRGRLVVGSLAGAAVFWLMNGVVYGWGWLSEWLRQAAQFGSADAVRNGFSASSILGFAQNLSGSERGPLVLLAIGLAGVLWLGMVQLWRGDDEYSTLFALLAVVFVLGSPHAMSHEVAVTMITVAVVVERSSWPWSKIVVALGALVAAGSLITLQASLGWSPGFPIAITIGAVAIRGRRRWTAKEPVSADVLVAPQ